MANKKLWLRILVMVLVFGMVVIGCDDNNNNNGNGNGDDKPPEQKTTAERWSSWADPSSTATITHSVDTNGVCTITVGGTAMTGIPAWDHMWKVHTGYEYTAVAGKYYTFEFEAWTQSGTRELNVQWYVDNDTETYLGTGYEWDEGKGTPRFSIDSTRRTYTFVMDKPFPLSGVKHLLFECANQTGTFYVKIISINEGVNADINLYGTWNSWGGTLWFYYGNWQYIENGIYISRGTYTTNNNKVTQTMTQLYSGNSTFMDYAEQLGIGYDADRWYEITEIKELVGVQDFYNFALSFGVDPVTFIANPVTYSIVGDTLYFGQAEYTRW